MLNKVMLIGNVGQDPEIRYLDGNAGNAKVATLRLATTERFRDRNSGETRESTEWHTVVAWRGLADLAEKYIRKGSQIYVEGRIRTRTWEDQTGNRRYATEINADNIQMLGRRSDNQGTGQGQYRSQQGGQPYGQQNYGSQQPSYNAHPQPQYQQPAQTAGAEIMEPDDDLPF